jgi:hypothetical protein
MKLINKNPKPINTFSTKILDLLIGKKYNKVKKIEKEINTRID